MPDIHWAIARRRHLAQQAAKDAEWQESDHPREHDGKFGSGGGAAKSPSELFTVQQPKRAPFVDAFLREHMTIAGQEKYLQSVPSEKLKKGIDLIGQSKELSAGSQHVEKLMRAELKRRGE